MGNNTNNDDDCVDVSGIWTADPFTYFKMYDYEDVDVDVDVDQPIEIMGPTALYFNLTQNECQLHGINIWDNGIYSGFHYMVGTVDGSTVDLTEVRHDSHADGRHQGIVSDDGSGMSSSFIGHTNDYTMAFDSIMARSDTAPNADPRSCDVDLIGTWKSIQDVTIENLDADGGSLSTTFPEVNFTIDGQSENGCEFWGDLGILSLYFGEVVLPDGTTLASSTKTNSGSIKGISNAHIIKSNDGGEKISSLSLG